MKKQDIENYKKTIANYFGYSNFELYREYVLKSKGGGTIGKAIVGLAKELESTKKENRLEKLEIFLKHVFDKPMQSFTTENFTQDPMVRIYDEDNIQVDWCHYYDYIEIFGLTNEEYMELKKNGVVE